MILTVDSVTFAMKAKRLLNKAGVYATVIKLNADGDSCAHGVRINKEDFLTSARVLREDGISYSVIFSE